MAGSGVGQGSEGRSTTEGQVIVGGLSLEEEWAGMCTQVSVGK